MRPTGTYRDLSFLSLNDLICLRQFPENSYSLQQRFYQYGVERDGG